MVTFQISNQILALHLKLKVGDFVSWNASGGRARGVIEKIVRDGKIDVPSSSFVINGTKDDPAALICVYRKAANTAGYNKTDIKVGHRFSTLTKIDPLPFQQRGALHRVDLVQKT